MPPYYVLMCLSPLSADHYELSVPYPASDLRWENGGLFSPSDERESMRTPAEPIELATEPVLVDAPYVYAELYWNPIPLMTRRLVASLEAAGVDNLQTFTTRLTTPDRDTTPPDEYLAVNVIGKVAAADLSRSRINPDVPDRMVSMDFHALTIDERRARNLLMFRLAENVTAVLVDERVKLAVEGAGLTTLTWIPPEQWAG
jgi:hypothetical protein